jgi:hypothetical protein
VCFIVCFNVVYIKVSHKPTLRLTEHQMHLEQVTTLLAFGRYTLFPCLTHHPISTVTFEQTQHNERCTQTQPSVVDEPDSMPPRDLHRYPCQGMCL